VQARNFTFPNFHEKCPLCHGKDCAVRTGYYYRWALDIDPDTKKIVILLIPIARYLCKMKQQPKHKHRTFSMIPDTLIPYRRFSIDLLMFILQLLIIEKFSSVETLNKIDSYSPDACIVSGKTLARLLILFEQTRIKLIIYFQQYTDRYRAPPDFSSFTTKETLYFLMRYPKPQAEGLHCAAYYLSFEYYNQNGSYLKNARFLFGTASQFCT